MPLPRVLRLVRTRGVKSLLLHYTGASAYAGPVWNETLATMRAVAPCSELPAVRLELRGVPAAVVAPFFEVLLPRQLTGLSLTVRPLPAQRAYVSFSRPPSPLLLFFGWGPWKLTRSPR